jgi:hypothetical protein
VLKLKWALLESLGGGDTDVIEGFNSVPQSLQANFIIVS